MVNLSFSATELDTLKEYFQSELLKAQEQVDNILGILGKIEKKPVSVNKVATKGTKKGGRSRVVKPAADKKKTGPKPKSGLAELIEILDKSETSVKKKESIAAKPASKTEVAAAVVSKPAAKAKTVAKKGSPAKKQKNEPKVKAVAKKEPKVKKAIVKAAKPVVAKKTVEKKTVTKPVTEKTVEKPKTYKKPRSEKRTLRVKLTPIGKTPEWAEWVISVVKDNPQMVSHQVADAVINKYDLSGDNLVDAPAMVDQFLGELVSSGVLMAYGDDLSNPMYGLKMTD